MKKRDDLTDAAASAWKMFEKTGGVNYYLLYKSLTEK